MSSETCSVCPHRCRITPGFLGACGARGNRDGRIVDLNFGMATALALDPIEKKPLAMFHPGSKVLSYGSYGCNLKCAFCQNSDISMADASGDVARRARFIAPEELVAEAVELKDCGNIGVALTYNEPLIAPEYLIAVGNLLHRCGMLCVAVTNGYVCEGALAKMLPALDAMNIDLKCFSETGYRKVGAPGGLDVVKGSIRMAHDSGIHVEVTTLVVPGLSDDAEEFRAECEWLASIDPGIPLHLSRFFPMHKMADAHPTDVGLLLSLKKIACEYLEYVFLGNV